MFMNVGGPGLNGRTAHLVLLAQTELKIYNGQDSLDFTVGKMYILYVQIVVTHLI